MPTRKQRRRRQKDLRHEYEYVYVDGEGQEVEVDESSARRNGKREAKATTKSRNGIKGGVVQPPSWNRVVKRVAVIAPLLFVPLSALNHHQSLVHRGVLSLVSSRVF